MRRLDAHIAVIALAAAVATGVCAQPVRVIDLATFGTPEGELKRIYGSSQLVNGSAASGARGVPVAGGGDVDDDGFQDYAFTSVEADPLDRVGAGEIIVLFGDDTIGGSFTTAGFAADRLKIAGQHAKEAAGVEIEIADVTGDGVSDLLIGRQNHTPEGGRPGAGALTILVGGPELRDHAESSSHLDLGAIPAALTAATFVGASSYDRLGIWMRTGDVDGDGIDDIVVGADEVDDTVGMVTLNNGSVYVIRGGAHLEADQTVDLADFGTVDFVVALDGHVAWLRPPPGSNDFHLGAACQMGDLDGNGKAEVIAAAALNRSSAGIRLDGAPGGTGEAGGGSPHGDVFIAWDDLFPPSDWASGYTVVLSLPSASVTRISGATMNPANQELGEELLAGLDYDGDGANDIFLGDLAGNGGNGSFSGVGHVIFNVAALKGMAVEVADLIGSPPPGVRHTLILGAVAGAIGADTALHGDYDGDGLADLGFCNPKDSPEGRGSAGSVHVIFGEVGGWPAVIDLAPADLPAPAAVRIVEIQGADGAGPDSGDTLCYSAASGDIDADGVVDLLINEMEGNGFMPDGDDPETELDPAPDVGNLLLINGAKLVDRVLLDIDGNGIADPLTDGVLILRFLFGFTGTTLVQGALGNGATRTGPQIEEYLARAGAALDADGDDTLQALTDGVLALRFLFGFSGATLISGAVDPDATRTDAGAIAGFLDRLMPSP
jgi:hypothetical protein